MISYDLSKLGFNRLSFYLALEKYLVNNNCSECFFLWRIDKSIIIGRNQLLESEINLDYALELGCEIFRRPSGGGAIFADSNCFMFTFITKIKNQEEVYKTYLNKIINSLKKLNLEVIFSGRNDLLFDNRKFSGNSIYYEKDYTILHGTFLYNTNLEDLVKCITPSNDKLISKGIKSVKQRVVNLKDYLNISIDELMSFLVHDMSSNVIELDQSIYSKVSDYQKQFDNYNYVYKLNPPYSFKNKIRFPYGSIEVLLDVKNNKIKSFNLYGDFFEIKQIEEFSKSFINLEFDLEIIKKHLEVYDISNYIYNAKNEDIRKLLGEQDE